METDQLSLHCTIQNLKMITSAPVVETSVNVNNNSSFQNYTHPDDHKRQTTDTPGFKPFTKLHSLYSTEKEKNGKEETNEEGSITNINLQQIRQHIIKKKLPTKYQS